MVEAASEDKKVLGRVRERREDPDIHRNNRLLYDGNCAEENGYRQAYLRDATTCKCVSLTEKTPLDKLFGKPNYNIVNELDGSTEPTLFDC